ncbi:MAG: 50S ribosomal protein L33 [bacterium]|nr:50S ribosomal protein L33 [bacterium]
MRDLISYSCGECKRKNYVGTKNKKKHPDRMEVKKFCRFCRKHTMHKESK